VISSPGFAVITRGVISESDILMICVSLGSVVETVSPTSKLWFCNAIYAVPTMTKIPTDFQLHAWNSRNLL
jgi:hypothetical protein